MANHNVILEIGQLILIAVVFILILIYREDIVEMAKKLLLDGAIIFVAIAFTGYIATATGDYIGALLLNGGFTLGIGLLLGYLMNPPNGFFKAYMAGYIIGVVGLILYVFFG